MLPPASGVLLAAATDAGTPATETTETGTRGFDDFTMLTAGACESPPLVVGAIPPSLIMVIPV